MLPVILAVAYGFYTMVHGRQQTRLIGGYVKEFFECESGPQWFTRLGHLEIVPGFSASTTDWLSTMLANAVVVTAVVFAWLYSSAMPRGELYAGIVTGCGMVFAFHSVTETTRLRQSDAAGLWRQIGMGPMEERQERRPQRMASR
jgi:acyl-CoA reductase-like NAD-dependent aldehyde dehydrogenase